MNEYKCKVIRVVDGDTVDVDIDLGFSVTLSNERVRIVGIDAPESRTSNKVEKLFGKAATAKLESLLKDQSVTLLSKEFKGKFGRILGDFKVNGTLVTETLVKEHFATVYAGKRNPNSSEHLANREFLMKSGIVDRTLVESLLKT